MRKYSANKFKNTRKKNDLKTNLEKWLLNNSFFILAALIPLLSYTLAYIYELSYALTLHIPIEFIKIDVITVISIMIFFGTLAILGAYFFLFLDGVINYKKINIERILYITTFTLFLFLLFFLPQKLNLNTVQFIQSNMVLIINIVGLFFLIFLGIKLGIKSFFDNFQFLVFVLVFIAFITFHIGQIAPTIKSKYWIYEINKKNMIVLRIYGDTMIVAPYNILTNTLQEKYTIVKLSDASITLQEVQITPLIK